MQITLENLQRKSKDYREYKANQEKPTNDIIKQYIFFIFANNEQEFNQQLQEKGLTKDEITSYGAGGGYCKKKDKPVLDAYFEKLEQDKQQYLMDQDNFYGALYYELWNYEYYYNADNDAVAGALGIDASDVLNKYPASNDVINIYVNEFEKNY